MVTKMASLFKYDRLLFTRQVARIALKILVSTPLFLLALLLLLGFLLR